MLSSLKSSVLKKEIKYLFLLGGWQGDIWVNQINIIYRVILKAKGKIEIFILMWSRIVTEGLLKQFSTLWGKTRPFSFLSFFFFPSVMEWVKYSFYFVPYK